MCEEAKTNLSNFQRSQHFSNKRDEWSKQWFSFSRTDELKFKKAGSQFSSFSTHPLLYQLSFTIFIQQSRSISHLLLKINNNWAIWPSLQP